jgi:hypothetical protein
MLSGRNRAVNVGDDNPTLLDVIQRHFLPESRVSVGGSGGATTYPPLNHRVAVYRYTNEGPTDQPPTNAAGVGLVHVESSRLIASLEPMK